MGTTMGRICCGSIIWRTPMPNDVHGSDPFESGVLGKGEVARTMNDANTAVQGMAPLAGDLTTILKSQSQGRRSRTPSTAFPNSRYRTSP
jgi:hypothetical protein